MYNSFHEVPLVLLIYAEFNVCTAKTGTNTSRHNLQEFTILCFTKNSTAENWFEEFILDNPKNNKNYSKAILPQGSN